MNLRTALFGAGVLCCIATSHIQAQDRPAAPDSTAPLRVFVDCQYNCDTDFLRQEMPWVDYMRDRADAQVHILITGQGTGGGGSIYTVNFIGLKQFAAFNDTLNYTSTSEDSNDTQRRGLTKIIQLGMMRFIAHTPAAQRFRISLAAPSSGVAATPAAPKIDPWKAWVFRLGFNASGNGESKSDNKRYSGNVSASRTTEQWKSSLSVNSSQSVQSYTFPITDTRDTTQTFFSRSSSSYGSLVRSLGANFSAGVTGSVSTSTYGNTKVSWSAEPAVEYDFFPYKESNRRMLTAEYSVGVRSYQYRDSTIYFKIQETHPHHSLSLSYYTQEQWGSVNVSSNYSQYLHDASFFNAGVSGGTDVRLFKGFSFNVNGSYQTVRDQLSLKKGAASQADILLRQREQATDFRYYVGMGLSYRFGSIFNNVVNPRMGGGGGGGERFFF